MLVIGGGWAGVAAAVEAQRRGWQVTLVEERPYVGGRARSFTDRTTGEEIDNGQHLMMGCYHAALRTMQALGTDQLVDRQSALRVSFVEPGGRTSTLAAGRLPGRAGVAAGIWGLQGISTIGRLAILRMAARLRLNIVKGAGKTCRQLLQYEGQPPEAITRFWEPIILATLNATVDQAPAELLVAVMQLAFLGSGEDSKLYLPKAGLSHFVDPLMEYLPAGSVYLSTSADQLEIDPANRRITSVTLSNGEDLRPEAVVAAIPQAALQRLVGDHPALGKPLSYSPIVSVYLWYDREWMQQPFVAALGTVVQWVFNRRKLEKRADPAVVEAYPGHVSLTISAGSDLAQRSAEDIIAQCDTELRALYPLMQGACLLHGQVIKEKRATPLFDVHETRPPWDAVKDLATNLAIAGDWTDTGLPATIEGAARSGITAVEGVSALAGIG